MHLSGFNAFLADATSAAASGTSQTTGSPTNQPQSSPFGMLIPLALFFVIIYFMMIRPQSQQRKKQMQLLETLKSGDRIVTASGIVGVVISVKDKTVSIRSMDAKMEVTKSSVTEILERDGENKSEKSA
jgi:preprotein translocase subunit YajC